MSEVWSVGGSFSKAEILGNVAGTITGYDLKMIANISDSDVAEVSGKTMNFKAKAGNFTVDLILVHATRDVAAGAGNRYIYAKATGKLCRDKNGDAVWDAGNSRIDLKTGATNENKLVTVIYSDEGTTFYQDMTASQLEYKGF